MPEGNPDGRDAESPSAIRENGGKPPRRFGCMKLVLCGLATLCLGGGCWAWKVERAGKQFVQRVDELVLAAEARLPELPEERNAAFIYRKAFDHLAYSSVFKSETEEYGKLDLWKYCLDLDPGLLARYLSKNATALDLVRRAAGRPECDFGLDLHSCEFEQAPQMRHIVRLLCVSARAKARAGNAGEALDDLITALAVARHVGRRGVLVHRMVQVACEGLTASVTEDVVKDGEPDAIAVERLLAALEGHCDHRGSMQHHLQFEKPNTLAAIYAPLVSGRADKGMVAYAQSMLAGKGWRVLPPYEPAVTDRMRYWFWRNGGLTFSDARHYEEVMDQYVTAAGKPYPQSLAKVEDIAAEECESSPWYREVSAELLGSMPRIFRSDAAVEAKLRVARLGLGCLLHKLKFGRYPEDLADLPVKCPGHFRELPADPFTGKPMIYRKSGKGCVVYSVAKDREDNGGKRFDYNTTYDWGFEVRR